jgi:signal transduction histidine kinase
VAQVFLAAGTTVGFAGFGKGSAHWSNILTVVFVAVYFYFLFARMFHPWLIDLWRRGVIHRKESLTTSESCALWYFLSAVFIVMLIPGVTMGIKLFSLADNDSTDIYAVLFSFSGFGIITNIVPGRLARNAIRREKEKALETKQTLVRYMGHEMRSPLNVIMSGLKLLQTDVSKLQSPEERAGLMDTVASMQQESDDLLKILNDLLLLEKMESAAFSIEEKMVPCADLLATVEKYGVAAREKGIDFSVQCLVGQQPVETAAAMVEEGQIDIEHGGAEEIKEPDPTALSLCVDELKIGQVLRNLVTNAIKFTPADKSITVILRQATSADLTEEDSSTRVRPKSKNVRRSFDKSGYCLAGQVAVEVADTGAGITKENWSKVFGKFEQFDASTLQVASGLI